MKARPALTSIILLFLAAVLAVASRAEANEPLYGQTIVTSGSIQNGDTLVTMGMSNWNQINQQVSVSEINLVNAACGGCVVGTWSRGGATSNGRPLWNAVPSNADVVWINPVNRAVDSIDAYVARTTADLERLLLLIADRLPNVSEVWLTGLHGEPFAPANSKQPDIYAWWSGVIADRVAANPPAGLPFIVRHAAYIYAETTPRADGLFWERADFSNDLLHLSASGNRKAAGLLEDYIANALGAPPPDDPPPTGAVCEPIAPQTKCSTTRNPGFCTCAFPETMVPLGDEPPPDPNPEQCPIPTWASECRVVQGECRCR